MNPVVEAFAELFKPYAEAAVATKAEEDRVSYSVREKARQDLNDWSQQQMNAICSKAIGQYQGVTVHAPWVVKKTVFSSSVGDVIEFTEEAGKAAGDTIHYATPPLPGDTFLPPEAWSFTVPEAPPPVKRFRKRKK